MTGLTETDRDALFRIRKAGADGVRLGDIPVSAAIRLQLFGAADVRAEPDGLQRAFITRQGAAMARSAA